NGLDRGHRPAPEARLRERLGDRGLVGPVAADALAAADHLLAARARDAHGLRAGRLRGLVRLPLEAGDPGRPGRAGGDLTAGEVGRLERAVLDLVRGDGAAGQLGVRHGAVLDVAGCDG